MRENICNLILKLYKNIFMGNESSRIMYVGIFINRIARTLCLIPKYLLKTTYFLIISSSLFETNAIYVQALRCYLRARPRGVWFDTSSVSLCGSIQEYLLMIVVWFLHRILYIILYYVIINNINQILYITAMFV